MAKLLALVPPIVTEVMASDALPALVRVKVAGGLDVPLMVLKFTTPGLRAACGAAAAVPVQLNATDSCGSGEGKFTPRFAVRAPVADGVQVIEIMQLAPAARLTPQLLVWLNELALVPKNPKLLIPWGTPPVLLRVAVCTALVV